MDNELNQKLIETLDLAAKENRVANAYLFEGEDEALVLKIAEDFARKLCKAEMDLQYLVQEKETLISVKDVRDNICGDASIKPYGDGRKVYIVKHAELMNISAQNALLKTLEEPPQYVSIFLLTKNRKIFLPTILSRTVKYTVISETVSTADELQSELQENVKKFFEDAVSKNAAAGKELVKLISEHKELAAAALNEIRSAFRDAFIYREGKNKKLLLNQENAETEIRFSEQIKLKDLSRLLKIIDQTEDRIKAGVNAEMALQFLLGTILDAVS